VRFGGFSDVEFEPPEEDIDENDFYKSKAMAAYLENYVQCHEHGGITLRDRIHFGATVQGIAQTLAGWTVQYTQDQTSKDISARKIVIATGSTSVPNMPDLEGSKVFGGPIVHTLDYGRSKIYEREDIESIAVLGGGKSAADMVYENVKAGRRVKWIIRASGKGPGAFVDIRLKIPWLDVRNAGELGVIRFATSIITMPGLQSKSWWQTFLYDTRVGARVLGWLRAKLNQVFVAKARFEDRPGARETFRLLKTEIDAGQMQKPAGGCHHEDFWDTIAQNVDVYRQDIDHLENGKIVFIDGGSTDADAILCGTGFHNRIPFLTDEQCVQMGLPHRKSAELESVREEWAAREARAEKAVHQRIHRVTEPALPPQANQFGDTDPTLSPFRLYNGIIPTSPSLKHSIAFVGFATMTNMFASSELGAIYATAFLDGSLVLPSEDDMKDDIAYVTTYMRIRNPTYGLAGNWWIFDYLQWVERILDGVGLKSWRKGWWGDLVQPLFRRDFKGLKDEYIANYAGGVDQVEH
jgi:hypothetical protein